MYGGPVFILNACSRLRAHIYTAYTRYTIRMVVMYDFLEVTVASEAILMPEASPYKQMDYLIK